MYQDEKVKAIQDYITYLKQNYKAPIDHSISNTLIFDETFKIENTKQTHNNDMKIIFQDLDTVSAVYDAVSKYNNKIACLNFASYKNPGGGFLQGYTAQEESLCQQSILYPVLAAQNKYYLENVRNLNYGLYTNRGLYTPDILFLKNKKEIKCDIITCAAPNKSYIKRYKTGMLYRNDILLRDRIRFVFDIAQANNVETFILGAYGCGVFKQNPTTVAIFMKELLKNYDFKTVIFAIPGKYTINYKSFKEVFEED